MKHDDILNPKISTLDCALSPRREYHGRSSRRKVALSAESVACVVDRISCRQGIAGVRINREEKLIAVLHAFVVEALNGGFHQFLANNAGATAEAVKEYAKVVGAQQTRHILTRLSKAFANGKVPASKKARQLALQAYEAKNGAAAKFAAEDHVFRDGACDELLEAMYSYISGHLSKFVEPEDATVKKHHRRDEIRQYYLRAAVGRQVRTAEVPRDREGQWGLLSDALQAEDASLLRELVGNGLSLDLSDTDGWGPLHHCIFSGRLDLVEPLVSLGADVNKQTDKGWTPLFFFRKYGERDEEHRKVYSYLKAKGAYEHPDIYAGTAL